MNLLESSRSPQACNGNSLPSPYRALLEAVKNNQHNALNCTIPLFNILAYTRFGSSLPSSGSLLDPSELLQIQIEQVVYLKYITDITPIRFVFQVTQIQEAP
jgi:hypothetical protein